MCPALWPVQLFSSSFDDTLASTKDRVRRQNKSPCHLPGIDVIDHVRLECPSVPLLPPAPAESASTRMDFRGCQTRRSMFFRLVGEGDWRDSLAFPTVEWSPSWRGRVQIGHRRARWRRLGSSTGCNLKHRQKRFTSGNVPANHFGEQTGFIPLRQIRPKN